MPRRWEPVVQSQAHDHAQRERPGDEGAPGEHGVGGLGDGEVDEIAGRRAGSPGHGDRNDHQGASPAGWRPAYFTTSISSRTTSPSSMRSSSAGTKALIFSSLSTITITIGRSSERLRMRAVWRRLLAP